MCAKRPYNLSGGPQDVIYFCKFHCPVCVCADISQRLCDLRYPSHLIWLNKDADMRIQLSALRPDTTEICENVKHCYSSPLLFLFWTIQLFSIKYITYTDEMVYYCLKWINKCWKIFSTLIFNTGNIGRYNLPCMKLFEVTDHFPVTEHRFSETKKFEKGWTTQIGGYITVSLETFFP